MCKKIGIYKGVVYYITKNFQSEALLTYFFISEITKDKEINPFSKSSNLRQRQRQWQQQQQQQQQHQVKALVQE